MILLMVQGFNGAEKLIKLENKIKDYLINNQDILYTLDTHYDNYLETQEGKDYLSYTVLIILKVMKYMVIQESI